MAGRLEAALRRDAEVLEAARLAQTGFRRGSAIRVWDGAWTQSAGQAGRGLAGVRQAIALEVGFAPRACKEQAVRGLVVVELGDTADAPRLALGIGAWRWTDLLEIPPGRR